MPSATDILKSKVLVPSELRSAQWDALPVWLKERSFFMSSVAHAEILDGVHDTVGGLASGHLSLQEARAALRANLAKNEYQPLPGQEGTIKDLRTGHRQNVALETNLLQVQNYARWTRQQAALRGFPAQRLVRQRISRVPRNWKVRWDNARAATMAEGCTDSSEMVALVNHPIWIALSRFGTPYPPFDFNSGMGIEPVARRVAASLGILPAPDASEPFKELMQPQDRGLNATLEATPEVRSEDLRNALAERLHGLAEWDGDKLVFTDPNGTKPYDGRALSLVWDTELPAGIPQLQRDAVLEWLAKPEDFKNGGATDQWEDIVRGLSRIPPGPDGVRDITDLVRGMETALPLDTPVAVDRDGRIRVIIRSKGGRS